MVIDENGQNLGVLSREEALRLAEERELDLVIVSKTKDNVVARIADVAKLKYEKSKKQKKQKNVQNKEIWFKPNIQERDLILKLEKAKELLEKGGNVKLTLRNEKSRKRVSNEVMYETMKHIVELTNEFAKPINTITREGRNLSITIRSIK